MIVEMQLFRMVRDEQKGHPLLVLKEASGRRLLPMLIGTHEAIHIHLALHGFRPERPQTHDLLASVVEALNGQVESVEITALVGNVYHAIIKITRGKERVAVCARPSDAIVLALLCERTPPIYVNEQVLAALECDDQRPPSHIGQDTSHDTGRSQRDVAARWRNGAAEADHGSKVDNGDAVIYVYRRWAYGLYFPAGDIDPIVAAHNNDLLIEMFLQNRCIRFAECPHQGVVALTGLDERPAGDTRNRIREARALGDSMPETL